MFPAIYSLLFNPDCVPSQHTFQSGNISPGNAGDTTYTRRFEFLPGCDYFIKSELTWASDNDTQVNDIRTLKVHTTACDSPDRPSHLSYNDYCNRRIHEDISWDSNEFTCVASSGICKQCFVDNGVFADCDGYSFCVNGMCDDFYECWSGSIEDGFEGNLYLAGVSERHFSDGNDFSFSGTLHKNSGEQDVDRTSWSLDDDGPSPMHFYNKVEVLVADRCDDVPKYFPFGDVEIRILLQTGSVLFPTQVELSPWTTPYFGVRTTAPLDSAQRQAVENGALIVVELRNVEDTPGSGTYPSLTYTAKVSVGTGFGGLIVISDSGYQFLPQGRSFSLSPNLLANDDEIYRFAISDDALAASDTIYFRPEVPYVNPSEAPDMLVVDGLGDVAVTGVLDDTGGVAAKLIRLIPDNGPFSVVLSSGDRDLKGELYRCPVSAQGDCFAFDVENYCDGTTCRTGEICCEVDPNQGIGCVDALNDVNNCGGCGNECFAGEMCLRGVCATVSTFDCAGTTCPAGLTCCEDSNGEPFCVSTETDSDHCGWCAHDCPYWAKCAGGWCLPRTGQECQASCTGDAVCCYALGWERCVDTSQNPFNCGGCGMICDWGDVCSDGECVSWLSVHDPCRWLGKVNCKAPDELDCSNLGTDEENCGSCGLICAHGSTCVNGVCTRPWGEEPGETDIR